MNARMRVRPDASATGFTTWEDELGLDQWRTGDVFGADELPVLFAHGQHSRPDSIVLATTEYRRAYAGKLPQVLARLLDGHLVWLGFSFADQRIAAVLREVADRTGTRIDPGAAPRHVAVMAWDPDAAGNDPEILARRAEIAYGAQLILYPAPEGDHAALARLLAEMTDGRDLAAGDTAVGEHLAAAALVFRDADYLTELATTLADLAENARVSGDLDAAERHATEAITIAAPRGLVLAHCAALAARARIRATQAIVGNPDMLYSGRDAADAAIRLAVRHEHPWCELDALRAHALLDQAEGIDRGWGAKADALHARLVPPGLDPDPLGTVERLVAEQKAAEAAEAAEESEG